MKEIIIMSVEGGRPAISFAQFECIGTTLEYHTMVGIMVWYVTVVPYNAHLYNGFPPEISNPENLTLLRLP